MSYYEPFRVTIQDARAMQYGSINTNAIRFLLYLTCSLILNPKFEFRVENTKLLNLNLISINLMGS
jgi:hypothetical protein